jgi:limonene 1,2-monooxygenase
MTRLRFGIFMAPFHPAGENPTLALQRDLELVEHLDRLGYDEAWIGEHHSAGSEIIASPEIFIAAAPSARAHQARHRRDLARLPQPAVGDRAHGAARPPDARPRDARRRPGSLPTDSAMIGLTRPTRAS